MEEGKICEHFEFVITKLQKLHKGVMWKLFNGRSFLEKTEPLTVASKRFLLRVLTTVSLVSSILKLGTKTVFLILRIALE